MLALLAAAALMLLPGQDDAPPVWAGPGRFCGYSPIIDLVEGETIEPLEGGIHSGSFRWTGAFGTLEVSGVGWAGKPPGAALADKTGKGWTRFAEQGVKGHYQVAIWNGRQGAAYFKSPTRLTRAQLAAIDRVDLFQEGDEPEGCKYRTIFVWE